MNFINLHLKNHQNYDQVDTIYTFDQLIFPNKLVVIIGSPGSGKTSILKKYNNENIINTQYTHIKDFLNLDIEMTEKKIILLLDGLDEFKSLETDKAYVTKKLGNRIAKFNYETIILTCREMDWYDEIDQEALASTTNKEIKVYSILPLNIDQKYQLTKIHNISKPQDFINKFYHYGFLDNPQMFSMIADIYKNNSDDIIDSKEKLYTTFIQNAREKNPTNIVNKINILDKVEMLKYTGYIAFYYIFCEVDNLDSIFADTICNKENNYDKETIEKVLNTSLFQDKQFIHRTIAEFALAYFIKNYKLNDTYTSAIERIKTFFIRNNKIPTNLRGTYAWMCSLTKDISLINIDPYYQTIYGDNAYFDNSFKETIILEIKSYSSQNPYFIDYYTNMSGLEKFYNSKLDNFFINEFNEALQLDNHFILFISDIITAAKEVSQKMLDFIKNKLTDNAVNPAIKAELVQQLSGDPNYLKSILELIKINEITDEKDTFKDSILRLLYPIHITSHEIVNYLQLYNAHVIGHCDYLYNTEYKDKYLLIDNIHKACFSKDRKPHLKIPDDIKSFIHDYFLETLFKYPIELTSNDIFNIIKHFRQYYAEYEQIKFYSFRYKIINKAKKNLDNIAKLSNDLFSLYIDDLILKNNDHELYAFTFGNFYNYSIPNKKSEILFNKMNSTYNIKLNQKIFIAGLNSLPRNEQNQIIINPSVTKIAKQFGLEEILHNCINPKKEPWQIEFESKQAERKAKLNEKISKNESYYLHKSDDEIQNSFNDLFSICKMVYFEQDIENIISINTFNRLKKILSNIIFKKLINPELLTIESLACKSPNANRNIDRVYYTACAINNLSYTHIDNKKFLQYLYIINLAYSRIINSIKGNFFDQIEIENREFIIDVLKQYIKLLVQYQLSDDKHIIIKYINHESNIDKLKKIAMSYESDNELIYNNIIKNFIYVYNFNIELEDLKSLSVYNENYVYYGLIHAIVLIKKNEFNEYKMNITLALYELFHNDKMRLSNLSNTLQMNIIDYMINTYNTQESIKHINGFQSQENMCASFLTHSALPLLNIECLQKLKEKHSDDNDIWKNRINNTINSLQQQLTDSEYKPYTIEDIKNYIFSDTITSVYDFYHDVILKLNLIKTEIEDNRDNNKKPFYGKNHDEKKIENDCRDEILRLLKNKYGNEIIATKEQSEAENRVDINLKYQNNTKYEIQVECKRDDNTKTLYTAIQEQLINKYFSSGVQYGIYIVFYFGHNSNKEDLLQQIEQSIPDNYINNIKVIYIDLTL